MILTATEKLRDQRSREVKECRELNVTFRKRHNPPFTGNGRWLRQRSHRPAGTLRRATQACAACAPIPGVSQKDANLLSEIASPLAGFPADLPTPLGHCQAVGRLGTSPGLSSLASDAFADQVIIYSKSNI